MSKWVYNWISKNLDMEKKSKWSAYCSDTLQLGFYIKQPIWMDQKNKEFKDDVLTLFSTGTLL